MIFAPTLRRRGFVIWDKVCEIGCKDNISGGDIVFEWLISLLGDAWLFALHLTGKSSFPKPLSAAEESTLVKKLADGDAEAREKLIIHNLRLVAHIAKKYSSREADGDDLVSIGTIGLIKAVNTFKQDAGRLTSYASRCIENEILMHLRSAKKNNGLVSLNDPIGADSDGNEVRLIDLLCSEEDVPLRAEVTIESSRAIKMLDSVLDKREKQVVVLRFGLADNIQRPQHETARIMGISRSYVSRIEKQALAKLRAAMDGIDITRK